MGRPVPRELSGVLAVYPPEVRRLVLALRRRVLAVMPQFHETVWDATNAVSLVYSPRDRWQDGVVHVASYSRHVNLGFNDGASLVDRQEVLVGSGARIRHVTFCSTDEVGAAGWLDDYLAAALAHAGLDGNEGDAGTTFRESTGPKRRPS